MIYNKDNLKNIYEYNPELIDKINEKVKMYKKHAGYSYHYEVLIGNINAMFYYFKTDEKELKHFIYHLANDKIYTKQSLNKIKEHSYHLYKTSNHNDYSYLLSFIKNDELLKEKYNRVMFMYDIWNKDALIQDVSYDLKSDPYDATAENILEHLLNDNLADWIQIKDRYRDDTLIEFKNEEEALKKLYKLHYEDFNKAFFNNLDLLKLENPNYKEIEQEIER